MMSLGAVAVTDFYEKDQKQFPEFFFCVMCKFVMLNAFQLSCGHHVCESCKRRLKNNNANTCPDRDCQQQSLSSKVYEDKYITRKIQTHQVVCKNALLGCTWEGIMSKYQTHLQNCPISLECSSERPEVYLEPVRPKLKNFQLSVDNQAYSNCEYCKKENLLTSELDTHQQYDCPNFKASCPFTEVGCPEHNGKSQRELLEHKNICSPIHLDLVLEDYCSLRRTCNEEFSKNYNTSKKWQMLENNFNVLQRDFLSMWQKFGLRLDDVENRLMILEKQKQGFDRSYNDQSAKALESRLGDIEAVLGCLQEDPAAVVRNGSIETRLTHVELALEKFALTAQRLEKVNLQNEKELTFKTARVESLEAQMKEFELTSHDGILIWNIQNFTQKRHDAITKKQAYILSPFFYSGPRGYKMCIRLYPNGDGLGKTTHISLFFTIMKGPFDALLPWPFKQPVGMSILDQNNAKHCHDSFRPDPNSPSFNRPKTEANISSGCPLFLPLSQLDGNAYVKDDCMFVKVSVEGFTA